MLAACFSQSYLRCSYSVAPAGPPVNLLPYPGCAAALKCVEERFCSKEGVMVDQPVNLTPHEKEFRVPLMVFKTFIYFFIFFIKGDIYWTN